MNGTNRIEDLMAGWLAGTLQDAEVREFLLLLESGGPYIQAAMEQWLEEERFKGLAAPERELLLLNGILEKIHTARPHGAGKVVEIGRQVGLGSGSEPDEYGLAKEMERTFPVWRKWKWMVAACFVLVASGIWFLERERVVSGPIATVPEKTVDAAPGVDGAVLTLADGSRMVLDSAANGAIAQQGRSEVIKNGAVVTYEPAASGNQLKEVAYNMISTSNGKQYSLVLADGSKVWLNAASSIRFPTTFAQGARTVDITGEVYFEIAQNPKQPFVVTVNNMQVEVLGTHFNINAYGDEPLIKTTLLEGLVRVQARNLQRSAVIRPGQQAQLGSAQLHVEDKVDGEEVVAWKNGMFQFSGADMQTVMRQLSRWYDVAIEYQGAIPKRSFEGEMQRTLMLSQVLKILEKNNVHFILKDKKLIVMP
jgi:ferric-dicitrate binding protein FerR (iron transport regulator)